MAEQGSRQESLRNMARYRNPWHKRNGNQGPGFFETAAEPFQHAGCLIYERIPGVLWDVVYDAVCISQCAGRNGAIGAAETARAMGYYPELRSDEMGTTTESLLRWMLEVAEARDTNLKARTVNLKFSALTLRTWAGRAREALPSNATQNENTDSRDEALNESVQLTDQPNCLADALDSVEENATQELGL